jgi:hypothetical protein
VDDQLALGGMLGNVTFAGLVFRQYNRPMIAGPRRTPAAPPAKKCGTKCGSNLISWSYYLDIVNIFVFQWRARQDSNL